MRGRIIHALSLGPGLILGHAVLAAGPQFTGLVNIYNPTSPGFGETSNSLALMDKDGPIAGNVTPLPGNWSDAVVTPGGGTFYTITSNDVWTWNAGTHVGTPLTAPYTGDHNGWMVGATWDTARNHLVVASLSGTGYLYSYLDGPNQWNLISDLQQMDLRSIAYRPSNDLIYALPNTFSAPTTEILKYNPATGQQVGALTLPQSIPEPDANTELDWQMTVASDGELAVIAPRFVPRPGGGTMPGNWLYLIDPDTGVINYSAPLPVHPPPPKWNIDSDGSWSEAENWSTNSVPDSSNANVEADMLGAITEPRTLSLDGSHNIPTLIFDNANKYTIARGSGGTLTIGDASTPGTITVAMGNHEIAAPLAIASASTVDVNSGQSLHISGSLAISSGKSLTKTGAGMLRISGAGNHAEGASLVVQQGSVQLDANQGTPNSAVTSRLAVGVTGNSSGTASTIVLNADQDLAFLTVSFAGAGTQTFDLHSPGGAGQFRTVRIYAADLIGAKNVLAAAIRNANAPGAPDPLDGIVDTGLHSGAGIGVAITGDHVTMRPTRIGDLNLDGSVTIADFIGLASNFNAVNKTWQEGDLNNDGRVSIADFIDLASNFGSSYEGGFGSADASDLQMLASFASSIGVDPSIIGSAVPEPTVLNLLAIALGLLRRRRRDQAGWSAGCSSGR